MRLPGVVSLLLVTVLGFTVLWLGAEAGHAWAQGQPNKTPAATQEPQAPIRVGVELVNLFATARDRHKQIVPNLTKDDFRIYEDSQEQKVAFFTHETALPITLGLLIDTSGSEQRTLPIEQEAATRFLDRVLRKNDLAMVMSFDIDVDLLADFTADRGQLQRAIDRARINAPSGRARGPLPPTAKGTSLYDAIYLACREKLADEAGRKAIVILTDAEDVGSKVRLDEALETAQRTNTVIHILLVYDPMYGANEGAARKLSEETGGRLIQVRGGKKIDEAFDQISEELRSQYTLGYYPTNGARDGKFRKIKVETTNSEFHVLTRKGYYAPRN